MFANPAETKKSAYTRDEDKGIYVKRLIIILINRSIYTTYIVWESNDCIVDRAAG
jgi:hypothetical protein